jgi:hypothetical protein
MKKLRDMKLIGVATADSRAYYSILSRLKKTNLRFVSLTPAKAIEQRFWPVITTMRETGEFQFTSIPMEELDEDPLIMEGQILSHALSQAKQVLLIGVDPGFRMGMAVYYGGMKLGSPTFNSVELLRRKVSDVVQRIPHGRAFVRIGDGSPRQSRFIAESIRLQLPNVVVEIVDEKGTSVRNSKGLTRDQVAAEKIAFRRGIIFQ